MSHQVLIVDNNDQLLDYGSLEEAHTGLGRKHRAFMTLLFDLQNRVLLQRRKHKLFDGLWDFTAISHNLHLADHDETYQEASDRAIKKEMGISHVVVNKVGAFNYFAKDSKNCEREYCAVLTGQYSGKFRPNPEEVYEAKWISIKDFTRDISRNPKKYTPWAKKAARILVNLPARLDSAKRAGEAGSKLLIVNRNTLINFESELNIFFNLFKQFVKSYFQKKIESTSKYPKLITRFYKELEEFGVGGKAMRPFLVYLGYMTGTGQSLNNSRSYSSSEAKRSREVALRNSSRQARTIKEILPICLAVELVHNFLLIHDDIIDKSDVRRGKSTVHKKFEKGHDKHYGISQAIIAGDIALLEAFDIVNKSDFGDRVKYQCLDSLVNFTLETGYGEALDIENSYKYSSIDDIWQVVELKTARYSFAGPLTLGAILARADKSQVEAITKYGLDVGRAFQLQDDILGVFADEKTLGKSTLSDMREGKNTVLYYKTRELCGRDDLIILEKIWGNDEDELALKKMKQISEKIKRGELRTFTEEEVKKKYGFK